VKIRPSSYFLIAIMAIMLIIIALSLGMEYRTSKLLPLMIGGIVFVLGAIQLIKELRAGKAEMEGEERATADISAERRRFLLTSAWVIGLFLAIWLLGFMVTIPLFILAYMKSHGIRWLAAITFAVIVTALSYGVFELLLRVELYRGLFYTWLTY
jgi:hypothetical protein